MRLNQLQTALCVFVFVCVCVCVKTAARDESAYSLRVHMPQCSNLMCLACTHTHTHTHTHTCMQLAATCLSAALHTHTHTHTLHTLWQRARHSHPHHTRTLTCIYAYRHCMHTYEKKKEEKRNFSPSFLQHATLSVKNQPNFFFFFARASFTKLSR